MAAAEVDLALQRYVSENGRYPCPAPLSAPLDDAAFGREVSTDCSAGDFAGTTRAAGRGGRMIRTGAVPVRSLNIPDDRQVDGWGHRYVYSVTENYASADAPLRQNEGAIEVRDGGGFEASAEPSNVMYVLMSPGEDGRGAWTVDGAQVELCVSGTKAGVNCAHQGRFMNSIFSSNANDQQRLTSTMLYRAPPVVKPCEDDGSGNGAPGNIAYLADTSGSMSESANCPASLRNQCNRMDVAHWALRRVVPARLAQERDRPEDERGDTKLTGFVNASGDYNTTSRQIGNPLISQDNQVDQRIDGLCPSGNTPLGVHIRVLAEGLGQGTPQRPNAILVISDGLSNRGEDPVATARWMQQNYPNTQVHILDVTGTPSLAQVAEITGGRYIPSQDGEKLLESMMKLSGLCETYEPPVPPVDKPACRRNW